MTIDWKLYCFDFFFNYITSQWIIALIQIRKRRWKTVNFTIEKWLLVLRENFLLNKEMTFVSVVVPMLTKEGFCILVFFHVLKTRLSFERIYTFIFSLVSSGSLLTGKNIYFISIHSLAAQPTCEPQSLLFYPPKKAL